MTPALIVRAVRTLGRREPVFRDLRRAGGLPAFPKPRRSAFTSLARSIVYQQLAGAAASTIWGRLQARAGPLSPAALARCSDARLLGCGLSGAKLAALRDLSARAHALKLRSLWRYENEDVIERLTIVRGIGRWTVEMFLMSHLRRPDVWPTGDLGVREGYRRAFDLDERPSAKTLEPLGDRFKPYRSVAAWYMWRATEQ